MVKACTALVSPPSDSIHASFAVHTCKWHNVSTTLRPIACRLLLKRAEGYVLLL